jgi:hypothetical protein
MPDHRHHRPQRPATTGASVACAQRTNACLRAGFVGACSDSHLSRPAPSQDGLRRATAGAACALQARNSPAAFAANRTQTRTVPEVTATFFRFAAPRTSLR